MKMLVTDVLVYSYMINHECLELHCGVVVILRGNNFTFDNLEWHQYWCIQKIVNNIAVTILEYHNTVQFDRVLL